LTDNEPDKQQEGRDMRVISLSRYREAVFRDISWLLNAAAHSPGDEIYEFENVAHSVLNFGIPDVCGLCSSSATEQDFEQRILVAIREFEPRILENSLAVQATIDSEKMGASAVTFDITGELWAQPANAMLYIKTALDLETGRTDLVRGDR
jgi:type VI secretion system protein ImpF